MPIVRQNTVADLPFADDAWRKQIVKEVRQTSME
jgi:hypothetical protein